MVELVDIENAFVIEKHGNKDMGTPVKWYFAKKRNLPNDQPLCIIGNEWTFKVPGK